MHCHVSLGSVVGELRAMVRSISSMASGLPVQMDRLGHRTGCPVRHPGTVAAPSTPSSRYSIDEIRSTLAIVSIAPAESHSQQGQQYSIDAIR